MNPTSRKLAAFLGAAALPTPEEPAEEAFDRTIDMFCALCGLRGVKYQKMKDLFEPPLQYGEMKQKLEKYKILFILGEPYSVRNTAFNILHDYYVKGFDIDYRSDFYRNGLQFEGRNELNFEYIFRTEEHQKSPNLIYYEDPFGRIEPESTQIFKSELTRIIERIQRWYSLVIITSRLDIFRDVSREFLMAVDLKDSYDVEKRKKIIDRYVSVYSPVWKDLQLTSGRSLKEFIAEEVTGLHCIDLFFEKSRKIQDITPLLEKVRESKDISKSFAEEIETCDKAEKAFFYVCYTFLGMRGSTARARTFYNRVGKRLTDNDCEFNDLLKKYESRVELFDIGGESKLRFSHPAFAQAVAESFLKNAALVSEILVELSQDDDARVRAPVAEVVADNFENLSESCRTLLMKLSKDENHHVRACVAIAVGERFEKLPEEYRYLLVTSSQDSDAKVRWSGIAFAFRYSFETLPEEYRNLFFELAKDESCLVRWKIAGIVTKNFEKLPEKYKEVLFELIKDNNRTLRDSMVWFVAYHFDELPDKYRRFLFDIVRAEDEIPKEGIPYVIAEHFENLPEEYRKLLIELTHDKVWLIRGDTAIPLGRNFEKLTDEYRKLLIELARDEDDFVRWKVCFAIGGNFEKLPEEYRKLLLELAKDEDDFVRGGVASAVCGHFEKLPEEYRKLLIELARDENKYVRCSLARALCRNFEELFEEYRALLLVLVQNASDKQIVADAVGDNFRNLTKEYRALLFQLAEEEDGAVRESVAETVRRNFDRLPEKYRRLLLTLSKDEDAAVRMGCIGSPFTRNFEVLPEEYKGQLLQLSEDEDASIRMTIALTVSKNFEKSPSRYQKILQEFRSDKAVLNLITEWIKENERFRSKKETIEILKRELNL